MRVRTRELDTLRLVCPKQWNEVGDVFIPPVNQGRYLGTTNKCGRAWLPFDHGPYIAWKKLVGAVGVAEWSWTPEFPASPFLRNLWVEPFLMLEKEVTW
ncbi:MAG: hypothetical protein JSW52_07205 [Candidatus Coatesbacteria bacterium]|nr:MAG: hypothetical protein JSW52_07205 [Candidatus Coatesbacteria bacterium]